MTIRVRRYRGCQFPIKLISAGSYGVPSGAPEQVHQLFCVTALITRVSTWPASDGALELFKILKPPGDLERYQFEDWRNKVVTLDQRDCYSAVYSRVGEAYVVLANLAREAREVNCKVNPEALKNALSPLTAGEVVNQSRSTKLDPGRLTGVGEKIMLPAANAILLHLAKPRRPMAVTTARRAWRDKLLAFDQALLPVASK